MAFAGIRARAGVLSGSGPEREAFWAPIFIFWGIMSCVYVYTGAHLAMGTLADTDIAMRLVQLRGLLEEQGWYDLSIPRLAPGEGYVSHWSRLADAGLLALLAFFSLFLPHDQAELAMRFVWPLLMFLMAMVSVAFIVRRLTGKAQTAFLAAGLVALSLPVRFYVGDIDHHGMEIALLMATWATLAHADRSPHAAFGSGLLMALTTAVSLEGLPFLMPVLGIVLYLFVRDGRQALPVLRPWLTGLFLGALLFLSLTVPPAQWLSMAACDAYAPNWALPLAAAAMLGLAILHAPAADRGWLWRAGLLLLPVAAGAGLFLYLDPACLKGPFAHIDPRIRPVWLDHVKEVQPIWSETVPPSLKAMWVWALLVGLLWLSVQARPFLWGKRRSGLSGGRSREMLSRSVLGMGLVISVAVALLLTFGVMRYAPYAQWLALPLMAALIQGLIEKMRKAGKWRAYVRVPLLMLASPLIFMLIFVLVTGKGAAASENAAGNEPNAGGGLCRDDDVLKRLNRVSPGLVVTTIDMGPYLLARTHHSVLAAPYHRLGESMLDLSRMLTSPPDQARDLMARRGVRYVLYCKGMATPATLAGKAPPGNALWFRLVEDRPPAWLEPVDLGRNVPLHLYRVRLGKERKAEERKGKDDRRAGIAPQLRRSIH